MRKNNQLFFTVYPIRRKILLRLSLSFPILLAIAILISPLTAYTQISELRFEHITAADGLAENSAKVMLQDHLGFIWIATQNGLHKYDGHDFTLYQYDSEDSTSIADNLIINMWEDKEGNIWIFVPVAANENGLCVFDRKTEEFRRMDNPFTPFQSWVDTAVLTTYTMTNDAVFWATSLTGGVLMVNPEDGSSQLINKNNGLPTDSVTLVKSIDGLLWFGWVGKGISSYQPKKEEWQNYPLPTKGLGKGHPKEIRDIIVYQDSLLFATIGNLNKSSIWKLNLNEQTWEMVNEPFLPGTQPWSTFISSEGKLWVNKSQQIEIQDFKANKKIELPYGESQHSVLGGVPHAILEDDSGVIWIGTQNYGIYKWDPFIEKIPLLKIPRDEDANIFITSTTGLREDSIGNLWVLSSHGLKHLQRENLEEIEHIPNTSHYDQIFIDSKNNLWLGKAVSWIRDSSAIPLWQMNLNSQKITPHPLYGVSKKLSLFITKIIEDKTETLWIASQFGGGLIRYNPDNDEVKQYLPDSGDSKSIPSNSATSLLWDEEAACLWVGTSYAGGRLCRFDLITEEFTPFPLQPEKEGDFYIEAIYKDQQKRLWVGGFTGLYFVDQKTGANKRFGKIDGLPQDVIYKIMEDDKGNLWIVHEYSISKLSFSKGDFPALLSIDIYDQSDGLQDARLFPWAILKSKSGRVYVGGPEGINYFDFDKMTSNPHKPPMILTNFKVKGKALEIGADSPLKEHINVAQSIELPHNQNDIAISFSALHFSQPEKNQFSYQLLPYEQKWSEASTTREAVYTNLNPGEYTFKVKGSNSDGVWNEVGISFDIHILPPWWQTWWAYSLYSLLLAALIYTVHKFQKARVIRTERAKSQARELVQAKEIEKAYTELKSTQTQLIQSEKMASLGELTAGIAHEIQNPLNFVNNFSEVNTELIDELVAEITSTPLSEQNVADAIELAGDIKSNEEKIKHHGGRADSIVKGMLQHSRTSSGEKVPTDINALAAKYLRLAYHGLKAKNISFNVTMETDFDDSIGKINVIPQDIGRVLLNLITNAFQACATRGASTDRSVSASKYKPQVELTTQRISQRDALGKQSIIRICVSDNGSGIPESIKDKIFQPFFTTKPTGEGTGLGLSLAYDIVKAHGGELKVDSRRPNPLASDESIEGQETEFIIELPTEISKK